MTQRVMQGIISCQLSNQLSEQAGFAHDPHTRRDSRNEEAVLGSGDHILVLAQGVEP
jgi:hypothetical protein